MSYYRPYLLNAMQLPPLSICSSSFGWSLTIIRTFPPFEDTNIQSHHCAFSRGDGHLVSAGRVHTVRMWDVRVVCVATNPFTCDSWSLVHSFHPSHGVKVIRPHENGIRSVVRSQDGRQLLTCSNDRVCASHALYPVALMVSRRLLESLMSRPGSPEWKCEGTTIASSVLFSCLQ